MNAKTIDDYCAEISDELTRLGTIYDINGSEPESCAQVYVVRAADGRRLLRVADGCGSEWFGDEAACAAALAELCDSPVTGDEKEDWQAGWDCLGQSPVDEPEEWTED